VCICLCEDANTHAQTHTLKQTNTQTRTHTYSVAHSYGQVDPRDLHYKKGRTYSGWPAYGQSKSANILHMRELSDQLAASNNNNITCLSLHPGVISTNLHRNLAGCQCCSLCIGCCWACVTDKSIPQGASTTMYALLEPSLVQHGGAYLDNCRIASSSAHTQDPTKEVRKGLWKATQEDIEAALLVSTSNPVGSSSSGSIESIAR